MLKSQKQTYHRVSLVCLFDLKIDTLQNLLSRLLVKENYYVKQKCSCSTHTTAGIFAKTCPKILTVYEVEEQLLIQRFSDVIVYNLVLNETVCIVSHYPRTSFDQSED